MRVVQITGSDLGGGAEMVVRNHHQQLARLGHETQLLVGRKLTDDSRTDEIPFRRGPKGVLRATRWLEQKTGLQNLYSPSFRCLEESFRFKPDVVHLHSLHGVEGFAELGVLRRLTQRFPCVVSLHDFWLMTGHCGSPMACQRWKEGCGKCPDLGLYPSVARDATAWNFKRKRSLFQNLNVELIVPSSWLSGQVGQSPVLKHLPVHVVGNPVDLDVFRSDAPAFCRRQLGIPDDAKLILMVAQHLDNPFKGIDQGVAAINSVSADGARVVLIGHSSEELSNRLKIPTTCLPFTKDSRVLASYYRMADVVVVPSRSETFGLVAAEAMACGTPVVAFRAGGLADVIGEDGAGVLVEQGDVGQMVRKLNAMLQSDQLRESTGQAAERRIQSHFSLDAHAEQVLEIYEVVRDRFQKTIVRITEESA